MLTGEVLGELPVHEGPRVVFGEACRLGRGAAEAGGGDVSAYPVSDQGELA